MLGLAWWDSLRTSNLCCRDRRSNDRQQPAIQLANSVGSTYAPHLPAPTRCSMRRVHPPGQASQPSNRGARNRPVCGRKRVRVLVRQGTSTKDPRDTHQ
jgi:hypothetical protein